jgi:hypothetical protein
MRSITFSGDDDTAITITITIAIIIATITTPIAAIATLPAG